MYKTNNWKWKLLWAVRHEFGEATHRPHFHFLMKTPKDAPWTNHVTAAQMIKAIWEVNTSGVKEDGSTGFADIRDYDPNKSGADYIMKADQGFLTSRANQYELQKFYFENMASLDLPLLVAPSVTWELAKRKSGKRGTDRGYNSEGLARFLRSLRSETSKSRLHHDNASSGGPERFVHPHTPQHILKRA